MTVTVWGGVPTSMSIVYPVPYCWFEMSSVLCLPSSLRISGCVASPRCAVTVLFRKLSARAAAELEYAASRVLMVSIRQTIMCDFLRRGQGVKRPVVILRGCKTQLGNTTTTRSIIYSLLLRSYHWPSTGSAEGACVQRKLLYFHLLTCFTPLPSFGTSPP